MKGGIAAILDAVSKIDLNKLKNLTYLPQNETNQEGVTYSVTKVGYFDGYREFHGYANYNSFFTNTIV